MSEYSFGDEYTDETSGLGETPQSPQGPKWFREGLDKLSNQNKELRDRLSAFEREQSKTQLAEKFKAAGVDPVALGAYTGEPDKVDDWLSLNKAYLKPLEAPESAPEQQDGPPASAVSADGQAGMQLMNEAGTSGVQASQGSEAELVNRIANAKSPEEFAQIMAQQGSRYTW